MATDLDIRSVLVLDEKVSLPDAEAVACGRRTVVLAPAAEARCDRAHARLNRVLTEGRHVYGLTTGFGPLANRLVAPESARHLQENLVNHLSAGVGPVLRWDHARAMVLARLMSILQGWSGASAETIAALVGVLNSPLAPAVPARGTVGASGDLTPLAHMVLSLQGHGSFIDEVGAPVDTETALDVIGQIPLRLDQRDGLALVNGTSAMTGIASLNAGAAQRAIGWATAISAVFCEVLYGRSEAWHGAFAEARPHPGQRRVTDALRAALQGSQWIRETPIADRRLAVGAAGTIEAEPGQDAYSVRCVPQILGAVLDLLDWHDAVVERELNAATDNPVFPPPSSPLQDVAPAMHGGNFMGQHVALVSDSLANAVVVMAGLAERQIARLTDEALNRGLPAFLHRGTPGLNSGFMGAQVTATALLAEMRATCAPVSAQSISTNAANQDVVSMGTVAARRVSELLADLARIHAILAMAVAQSIDLRLEMSSDGTCPSPAAMDLRAFVRRTSAAVVEDRPLGAEIETLSDRIACHAPPPGLIQPS